jgi:hypothetical protein
MKLVHNIKTGKSVQDMSDDDSEQNTYDILESNERAF